jgi:hypothetical protein
MKNVECSSKNARNCFSLDYVIRHSSFVILIAMLWLLPAKGLAQSSNRWLFIFNTSSAMHDRVRGVEAETQDLLTTAMHDKIRPGDTIGIWTYNSELHADEAPLQTWSPQAARSIAQNTLEFLSRHRYEKSASFDDVLANMLRVVKISDFITIILISDGNDPIQGTPFDAQLNSFYKENYRPQKKSQMPIVTIFRGEKGRITANTLNLAPWPVKIPAVPPPSAIAKAVATKPAPPPPPPVVPSLVIIGKKVEITTNPPTDIPEHAGEPAAVEPKAAAPKIETPSPASEPTPAVKIESGPAQSVTPAEPNQPSVTALVVEGPKSNEPAAGEAIKLPASNELSTKWSELPPQRPETAAAVPQKNLFSGRNIGIISVAFAALICVLLTLSARNARRAARASLITRSLDREKK